MEKREENCQKTNCDDCQCSKCNNTCMNCSKCYRAAFAKKDWDDYYCNEHSKERCENFKLFEIDFDKMIEIIHNAPISYGYGYDGSVQIKEPSYIISQEDMVKLFNYVKSL